MITVGPGCPHVLYDAPCRVVRIPPPPGVLALILLILAMACGPGARERTIRVTTIGLAAASDSFVAYDRAMQADIVAHATSEADGIAKLTAYQLRRNVVLGLFLGAANLLMAAAILDDGPATLATAIAAAGRAMAAWDALRGAH